MDKSPELLVKKTIRHNLQSKFKQIKKRHPWQKKGTFSKQKESKFGGKNPGIVKKKKN